MFKSSKFKRNDRLAIVGFAPTSRHMAPYNDPTWDLWGLNEAAMPNAKPEDRWWKGGETGWFQLHPKWDFMRKNNRNDMGHWDWLQHRDPTVPIFMQHAFRDVPGSVRYPIDEIIDLVGQYLTSSFSYMMALAIYMEYKTIALYGFEMAHDSEYLYQKAGAEYLIGFAKGRGIEVLLPPDCALLRGNLYAYEDLRAADRTYLGLVRDASQKTMDRDHEAEAKAVGRVELLHALLEPVPELKEGDFYSPIMNVIANNPPSNQVRMYIAGLVNAATEEYRTASNQYAYTKGMMDRTLGYIKWHDSQNIPNDRVDIDFRPKEATNEQA